MVVGPLGLYPFLTTRTDIFFLFIFFHFTFFFEMKGNVLKRKEKLFFKKIKEKIKEKKRES
jgi:hypothetical protein